MTNLNLDGLTDSQKRLFAVRSVRRVQHLMTDPRSVAVLDVAERHARGEATDEELADAADAAAADAADAAAADAADAADAAAWAAWAAAAADAADAAAAAAADAADAAAWAAAAARREDLDAAEAAYHAALDCEREAQREILEQIRKEGRE